MRYAIISDIHANRQALSTVLTDAFSTGVDAIICLGDLVGYGPEPAAVLEETHARVKYFVMGNHDAVIGGVLDPGAFNQQARRMIEWTAGRLDPKAGPFLARQPYVLVDPLFRCSHGSPASPGTFQYVIDDQHALDAWAAGTEQFQFIGHSHVPGLFVLGRSGTPHWLEPTDFEAEEQKRYIVNVGSVGHPRDGDARASYCLFDTERRQVRFRRVPFDLEAYRAALVDAKAPEQTTFFLTVADREMPPPLREMLDFHPLDEAAVPAAGITTRQLHQAESSARRWRLGAAILALLLLVAAGGGWRLRRNQLPAYTEYPALNGDTQPSPMIATDSLSAPESHGRISADTCLQHWGVRLAEPREQRVYTEPFEGDDDVVFRLSSETPEPILLTSVPVDASAGMRFELRIRCRTGKTYDGHAEMRLLQECADGSTRLIVHYPMTKIPADQWRFYHKSSPPTGLPADGPVRWVFQGMFTGELILQKCELRRLK